VDRATRCTGGCARGRARSCAFAHVAANHTHARAGGIGTLAQALAARRPQLIVPVAFDQPDNARRTVALGTAGSIPFRKATADAMSRELGALLTAPDYASRAREIGDQVN
jgi:UDP:flavonoid glycosyltransferase YjiC (YdhE family)